MLGKLFKKSPSREPITPDYSAILSKCVLDEDKRDEVRRIVEKCWIPNKARYEKVSDLTGVPSWVVFCIHYKEASCSFAGCLHNGDRIIGTGKLTIQVPKGRGPFKTWEDSATDALLLKKSIFPSNWLIVTDCLEFCEKYNGLGHRRHGELSPYVWAYTNQHDETGNYVTDGNYNPEAPIKSPGVASLMITLVEMGEAGLRKKQ